MERRKFLKATGAAAGTGAALSAGAGTAAAATEDPHSDRYVSADSSNYSTEWRGTNDINWIVVHYTVGSYSGAINWFQNSSANVSAHYVVSNYEDTAYSPGHTTQMVDHKDRAWHASASNTPSIGIEHEYYSDYGQYFTEDCYQASGQLIDWLCDEYDIPKQYYHDHTCIFSEPGGIIGHTHSPAASDCSSYNSTACPGPDWEPSRLMNYVGDGGGCEIGMDQDIATTTDLNGREGPGLHYSIVNTYPEGTQGYIMNGPEYSDGYTWWGIHFPSYDDWVWCVEQYLECI